MPERLPVPQYRHQVVYFGLRRLGWPADQALKLARSACRLAALNQRDPAAYADIDARR